MPSSVLIEAIVPQNQEDEDFESNVEALAVEKALDANGRLLKLFQA